MNIAVVIPTHRSVDFLKDWEEEFIKTSIYIVEDNNEKLIRIPKIHAKKIIHFSHKEIKTMYGKDAWIFPSKSAAIRSFGFLQAYKDGADYIFTLDDDCYPDSPNYIESHINNLQSWVSNDWYSTLPYKYLRYARGFPYTIRKQSKVMLSHGLWNRVPDLDGVTQLHNLDVDINLTNFVTTIPHRYYYPMSAMNLAFNREITPLMYQMLMGAKTDGTKWEYNRFDDIWSGIISKKILDHLGYSVSNGLPFVQHKRASDPFVNLIKEANGIQRNETFWQEIDKIELTKHTPLDCYSELINSEGFPTSEYFIDLRKAINTWLTLFSS